jgi:glycosyltransferase involved in cell wall biosynthesis
MREDAVSAVICTRNRPALLERCLSSLADLSPAAREVIVVDQSDGDASRSIVERWGNRIRSLTHLPSRSRGLSRARNEGIGAAGGDIVAFTDDDCLARGDWIGQVARAFRENPAVAAVTGGTLPDSRLPAAEIHPRILAAITWHPEEPRLFRGKIDPSLAGGGLNLSLRKSWIARIGGFDPDLGPGARFRGADDTDFLYRLLCSGGAILYDPEVVVTHLPWREEVSQSEVEFEYGHGIAAWALKWAGRRDLFPAWTAVKVLGSQGRRMARGILARDPVAVRTGRAYLAGLGRGTVAWMLARKEAVEHAGSAPEVVPRV